MLRVSIKFKVSNYQLDQNKYSNSNSNSRYRHSNLINTLRFNNNNTDRSPFLIVTNTKSK